MLSYLLKKKIKEESIDAICNHGFDSMDSLKLMTDSDITALNIVKGQERLLKAAVDGNCFNMLVNQYSFFECEKDIS